MKQREIIDPRVMRWVVHERDRACLYGLFSGDPCRSFALHGHHWVKRSQGGNDDPRDIITLCSYHHDLAEKNLIEPHIFKDILASLYGYEYGGSDVQETQSTRNPGL